MRDAKGRASCFISMLAALSVAALARAAERDLPMTPRLPDADDTSETCEIAASMVFLL
jgi:hypothetical protein